MNNSGPFSARFSGPWTDDVLRSRIAVRAKALTGLGKLGPAEAASRLEEHLKTVVVPTVQMVAALRVLIERAKAYCDLSYPNSVAVLALMYGPARVGSVENFQVTCLTGLAGVGKSALFDAFCRVFPTPEPIDIRGHARLELHACWRMTIRGRTGFSQLVNPHFRDQTAVSPSRILDCAVKEAASQGVALTLADEFQFLASGSANTMMANLLFRLAKIGPPVIYACNFSMLHALWRRPQQDRDRLLPNPIILYPEQLDDDWTATVEGCIDVAEEFSQLRNKADIRLLHDYTFGIKRGLRSLLVQAYLQMRKSKHPRVTTSHITAAYLSPAYKAMREDVEELVSGVATPSKLRKDLSCPFDSTSTPRADGNPVEHPATRMQSTKATHAAQLSMIQPELRKLVEALETQAQPAPAKKAVTTRRPSVSATNLIDGADRFTQRQKKDR